MRNASKLLVALILCLVIAGCAQQPSIVPSEEELEGMGLRVYWQMRVVLRSGETVRRIQLLDEMLYVLTSENRLVAVDAASGRNKWDYEVSDNPRATVFRPTHTDGVVLSLEPLTVAEIVEESSGEMTDPFGAVFINTIDRVAVLNRATGKLHRNISFKDFAANGAGVSDGHYFYVGSTGGMYYAYALNEAVLTWDLGSEGIIEAPLQYHAGRLFVASRDKKLYAVQTGGEGKEVWTQRMDGEVSARFHVEERGIFVPNQDGRLYAYDSKDGTRLWPPFVCQGPLTRGVQVSEYTLFQYADGDGFYAIDVAKGELRWRRSRGPAQVAAMYDGKVYLIEGRDLLILDEIQGTPEHSIRIAGAGSCAANVRSAAVFLADPNGNVCCLRPRKAGRLTVEELRGDREE